MHTCSGLTGNFCKQMNKKKIGDRFCFCCYVQWNIRSAAGEGQVQLEKKRSLTFQNAYATSLSLITLSRICGERKKVDFSLSPYCSQRKDWVHNELIDCFSPSMSRLPKVRSGHAISQSPSASSQTMGGSACNVASSSASALRGAKPLDPARWLSIRLPPLPNLFQEAAPIMMASQRYRRKNYFRGRVSSERSFHRPLSATKSRGGVHSNRF